MFQAKTNHPTRQTNKRKQSEIFARSKDESEIADDFC
jgi:hypothetical protein